MAKVLLSDIKTSSRHPGSVYAKLRDENGELIVSATLDYILAVAAERGYEIVVDPKAIKNNERNYSSWLSALYFKE